MTKTEIVKALRATESRSKRELLDAAADLIEGQLVQTTGTQPEPTPVNDPVNHPSHYTDGRIEVIDFIEDKGLNFHLGNTVKYVARVGKKDPSRAVQDLEKARWYLDREIRRRKAEEGAHDGD